MNGKAIKYLRIYVTAIVLLIGALLAALITLRARHDSEIEERRRAIAVLRSEGARVSSTSELAPGAPIAIDCKYMRALSPDFWEALTSLQGVQELSLPPGTTLGSTVFRKIGAVKDLRILKALQCELTGSLKGLEAAHMLEAVVLTDLKVAAPGLWEFPFLPKLERVGLHGVNVTPDALRELVKCPLLYYISLSESNIDDSSVEILSHSPQLEVLWLEKTSITDASLLFIARISSLRQLHVAGSRITEGACRRLRLAFPDAIITGGWDADVSEPPI